MSPAIPRKARRGSPWSWTANRRSSRSSKNDGQQPAPKSAGEARLTLPVTTVAGKAPKGDASCPTAQKIDEAVSQQRDLLAEFEKIADELNRVLANLEGSTLVKRLKAASRMQYSIAGRMVDLAARCLRSVRSPGQRCAPRRC